MDIDTVFSKLDEVKVMGMARGCSTMDELVEKMGVEEGVIMAVEPRIEWWFRVVEAGTAVRRAHEAGDLRRMLMSRRVLIRALWELGKVVKDEGQEALDVDRLLKEVDGMEVQDPMGDTEEEEAVG